MNDLTPNVREQLKEVRDGGMVNMMDRKGVIEVANMEDQYELVSFAAIHDRDWMDVLETVFSEEE